jgi:hypothetical protein
MRFGSESRLGDRAGQFARLSRELWISCAALSLLRAVGLDDRSREMRWSHEYDAVYIYIIGWRSSFGAPFRHVPPIFPQSIS